MNQQPSRLVNINSGIVIIKPNFRIVNSQNSDYYEFSYGGDSTYTVRITDIMGHIDIKVTESIHGDSWEVLTQSEYNELVEEHAAHSSVLDESKYVILKTNYRAKRYHQCIFDATMRYNAIKMMVNL